VAGAVAAVLLAILAIAQIWRRHALGAAHVAMGLAIAATIFAWPALYARSYIKYPAIADVSTDTRAPPAFQELARQRGLASNPVSYPGGEVAARQAEAYPDLRTFAMERSAEEAFEIVRDGLKRLKLQIVAENLPTEGRRQVEGIIEAVDRTMLVGFYDDIVVRVRGDDRQSRVDVRSASRYGHHDLGRNAQRIRAILTEIQARLEASVPGSRAAMRLQRLKARGVQGALPRQGRPGDRSKEDRTTGRVPGRSDARREPGPTDQQPARDARRARDTQDQRSPR